MGNRRLVIADSVTELGREADGAVALAASHGGRYAVLVALKRGVAALLVHDAGVGRDDAGIAGLALAQAHRIPCAALAHMSARIGDGRDCAAHGRISHVNALAEAAGLARGMDAQEGCAILRDAALPPPAPLDTLAAEARRRLDVDAPRPIWLLDSASLVEPGDADAIAVTGSHGGLLGGRPETAVKAPVFAALFNDAGVGAGRAGLSRLPALEVRGIAAATVAADSARIGEAASTYHDGIVSFVNRPAAALGGRAGMRASELVAALAHASLERTAS